MTLTGDMRITTAADIRLDLSVVTTVTSICDRIRPGVQYWRSAGCLITPGGEVVLSLLLTLRVERGNKTRLQHEERSQITLPGQDSSEKNLKRRLIKFTV